MKYFKILLLLVLPALAFSQHRAGGYEYVPLKQFLDQRFEGGEQGFLAFIYQNVKYPREARENCGMGVLVVEISLDKSGRLDSVIFKNPVPLGRGFEEEAIRLMKLSENQWKQAERSMTSGFTIGFSLDDAETMEGNLQVIAYGMRQGGSVCDSSAELAKKFSKFLEKEKYGPLKPVVEELLRRQPDHRQYREAYEKIAAMEKQ